MIKNVYLSICDNCDTVSLAPEYTPCINCGRVMVLVCFERVSKIDENELKKIEVLEAHVKKLEYRLASALMELSELDDESFADDLAVDVFSTWQQIREISKGKHE